MDRLRRCFIFAGILTCASLCCGGPVDCVAHQHPNGSVTYVLPKPLCPGQWSFNNTVIAFNEDNGTEYNKTLVSALAEAFITLKSCKHTLTFRKLCTAEPQIIHCSHNCSAMDLAPFGMQAWLAGKERAKVVIKKNVSGRSSGHISIPQIEGVSSRFHRGCLAAAVLVIAAIVLLILISCVCFRKPCCFNTRKGETV